MLEKLNRWIADLKTTVLSMVGKAVINAVNDTGDLQVIKIKSMHEETIEDVERIQEFGLTSNPPKNSEIVYIAVGGDKNNIIAIASDSSAHRPKLETGETAIYNAHGVLIKLDKNGNILIGSATADQKLILGDDYKAYFHFIVKTIVKYLNTRLHIINTDPY